MNEYVATFVAIILTIGIGVVLAIRIILLIENAYQQMKNDLREAIGSEQEMPEDEDNSPTI